MNSRQFVGLIVFMLSCAAVAAGQSLHESIVERYDLNRLKRQHREEVTSLVAFAFSAGDALINSGFKVYTLEQIQENGVNDLYVWSDPIGQRHITEHFMGAGAFMMTPGKRYLGAAGPLWLVLYKDGSEIKFTIR